MKDIGWGGNRSPTGIATAQLLRREHGRWVCSLDDGKVVDWPKDEPVHASRAKAIRYALKRWRCNPQ